MSDIFLNPIGGGAGGGGVTTAELNSWFATKNADQLADGTAIHKFINISGINQIINLNGSGALYINQSGFAGVASPAFKLQGTEGGNAGIYQEFYKNNASPAVNDRTGVITFKGNNDNGNKVEYGRIRNIILNPSSTARSSELDFYVAKNNSMIKQLGVNQSGIQIADNVSISGDLNVTNIVQISGITIKTNTGGSTQEFGFFGNGNANFPTGGTVQTGAINAQNSQSTLHSVVVNNNISAGNVIYTNSSVNASGAVQCPKTNTGFTTYTNYSSVNVSGQNLVGQSTIQTNGFNNISSANVNITVQPTVELWTRDRSMVNTGTLGGSLSISGTTSNISYGNGFTTYGLDNRITVSGANSYFSTWTISGATNNASGDPAFTISFWHYLDAVTWETSGGNSNNMFHFGLGTTGSGSACFFNQQDSVTSGPRFFFSQEFGTSNGNLTAAVQSWNHYAIVNGGNSSQTIYVNGSSVATRNNNMTLSGSNTLGFGYSTFLLGLFRYGCFRIFPTALTAAGITDLYNERFINPFLQTNNIVNIPRSLYIGNAAFALTAGEFWSLDLQTDNARKLTNTTWSTGSDERIKENIEEANYDMCYDVMKNLPLKYYKYKDDFIEYGVSDKHKLGWIAQDVEQYYPKAISIGDSYGINDFRNLNADQIYACMYGTIKKLMAKVEQLENKLGIEEVIYDLSLNDLSNNILNTE